MPYKDNFNTNLKVLLFEINVCLIPFKMIIVDALFLFRHTLKYSMKNIKILLCDLFIKQFHTY